jgi:hypothetical protein
LLAVVVGGALPFLWQRQLVQLFLGEIEPAHGLVLGLLRVTSGVTKQMKMDVTPLISV